MSWEILAILALVLLALEMLSPVTIFLWMAACVGAASLASWWGIAWQGQLAVFLLGVAGSLASYFLRRRRVIPPDVSAPAGVLAGLQGVALGDLAPGGRVHVGDGSWNARAEDGGTIADGSRITVTGHDGATLLVRALDPTPP